MKKMNLRRMISILAITAIMFFVINLSGSANAQPGPPSQHGTTGDQPVGGNAPIGSGLVISLVLGIAYGLKRIYYLWSKEKYEK